MEYLATPMTLFACGYRVGETPRVTYTITSSLPKKMMTPVLSIDDLIDFPNGSESVISMVSIDSPFELISINS